MASPQTEHGFARIANELLLALARTRLTGRSLRVLFAIFEQTYGRKRKTWWLSLGLLSKRTKISRGNCGSIVKELLEGHYLVESLDSCGHRRLGLQKDYEKWIGYLGPIDVPYHRAGSELGQECTRGAVRGVPADGYTCVPADGYQVRKRKEEETKKEVVVTRARGIESIPDHVRQAVDAGIEFGWNANVVALVLGLIDQHGPENVSRAAKEASARQINKGPFLPYVTSVLENQRKSGYAWASPEPRRARRYEVTDLSDLPLT